MCAKIQTGQPRHKFPYQELCGSLEFGPEPFVFQKSFSCAGQGVKQLLEFFWQESGQQEHNTGFSETQPPTLGAGILLQLWKIWGFLSG